MTSNPMTNKQSLPVTEDDFPKRLRSIAAHLRSTGILGIKPFLLEAAHRIEATAKLEAENARLNDEIARYERVSSGRPRSMAAILRRITTLEADLKVAREALGGAVRAAKLALFVVKKQGVMPNGSWERGFEQDLAPAESALSSIAGAEGS